MSSLATTFASFPMDENYLLAAVLYVERNPSDGERLENISCRGELRVAERYQEA